MTNSTDNREEQKFKWDDRLVGEFQRQLNEKSAMSLTQIENEMRLFKATHTPREEKGRDWEVVYCKSENPQGGIHLYDKSVCLGASPMVDMCSIYSVKRLSDGEVFSIGDDTKDGKIKEIIIRNINPESEVKQCWLRVALPTDIYDAGVDLMYAEKKSKAPKREVAVEKPPIGVIPKWLWEEQRLADLNDAIRRYLTTSLLPIPPEWLDERNELSKLIQQRKNK